jgi:hypothetical protein
MATRVGMLVGLLDPRLNEGADPAPTLPAAIVSGFGARQLPTVARGAKVVAVADALNMLFPAGGRGCADCLASFQLAFTNTVRTALKA